MKKLIQYVIPFMAVLLLAGCTLTITADMKKNPETPLSLPINPATQEVVPTEDQSPTTTPEVFLPVPTDAWIRDSARGDLAIRLGVDVSAVEIVSMTVQDWPDSCLGLPSGTAEACAKDVTPGYRLVLNAAGHTYEYRARADGSLVSYSRPVTITAPEPCMIHGVSFIHSPEDGYCFAYPVAFHRQEGNGPIALYGPAHGSGIEPLFATMTLEVRPLNPNEDLMAAVVGFVASLGEMPQPLTRTTITVGGQQAEMLEIVPGQLGTREVFVIDHGLVFHFSFNPAPSTAGEAAPDVESLYQTVIASMTFFS